MQVAKTQIILSFAVFHFLLHYEIEVNVTGRQTDRQWDVMLIVPAQDKVCGALGILFVFGRPNVVL